MHFLFERAVISLLIPEISVWVTENGMLSLFRSHSVIKVPSDPLSINALAE